MSNVRFGILSTANIGTNMVIPAMQKGKKCEVIAISSRNEAKAKKAADDLGLPKHYGSYEAMLADPDIDAVYNPLPNHLHLPWTLKTLQAGKHVLCEKPITMNTAEAKQLADAVSKSNGLKVMEAFMYRFHPRWIKVKQLVDEGSIGELKAVHSYFSYFNDNPDDIRNKPEMGGGGLMDIGCYCISSARHLFGREPIRIEGALDMDPDFKVDRLASGLLDFGNGSAVFSCSMRSPDYQSMSIFGTKGRMQIEWPFNPPLDEATSFTLLADDTEQVIDIPACNHYTLQGDAFADAILNDTEVPTPFEDAIANMKVIDAVKSR